MGLALLLALLLLAGLSIYFFPAHNWWLPAAASSTAHATDAQFFRSYLIMGVIFVAAQVALGLVAWHFSRRRATPASNSHGHNGLELLWTVLTAVLFLGLQATGHPIWAAERFDLPEGTATDSNHADAIQVEATGVQFAWYFRYPGPGAKFGHTDPKQIDASQGGESALGLDATDPAAKDDVVTGEMYLPVDRDVDLNLRAQDVIHSFFVPNMRFKQDAVPGLRIRARLHPTVIGTYEIACAELCGLGHYKMHAKLHVVSQQEFDQWLAGKEADKQ